MADALNAEVKTISVVTLHAKCLSALAVLNKF